MPWPKGIPLSKESLSKRASTLLPESQLARLANYLIANMRYAHFDIFHLRAYVRDEDTNQRAVTKQLKRLEESGFLMVTGQTKLPSEKNYRIVYLIRNPEFGSYSEWRDRPVYEARITRPQPHITVHRMQG